MDLHCLPNEVLYGHGYVMQSQGEIAEVLAFHEFWEELMEKAREEAPPDTSGKPADTYPMGQ